MRLTLSIIQVVISIGLVTTVLLQQRGSGGVGIFGMGSGTAYHTKRGFEKIIFRMTIALAVLFIGIALLNLFV